MERPILDASRRHLAEWTRDHPERKIAGVCASLADQFELPITLVRAAFVFSAVIPPLSSVGIGLYLVLWFLMPAERGVPSTFDRVVDTVSALTGDDPKHEKRREDRAVRRELEDAELR